jgi:effector-binding domain-containing protein
MNMKTLKKIIIWLLVLIGILILVAYLLPGKYNVERSTLIKGDRGMVFSMVCDFNNWKLWSPWSADKDSTVVIENIGCCEVGAVQKWDGEEMGKGEISITELIPGEKITWEMGFEGYSQMMLIGMTFEAEGDEWLVTWSAEGELGYNPLYRYYGLMIDSDLGMEYENGLKNLKMLCEKLPEYPGIEVTTFPSGPGLSVKDSVKATTGIGVFLEKNYPILFAYAMKNGGTPAGHPYAIYYNWDPEGMILMEAGIPLAGPLEGKNDIMAVQTPGGKVVKASHYGAYDKSYIVHEALNKYIMVLKMEYAGAPWEVYVTNPIDEPDTSKWETIVCYPIK